MEKSYKYWLDKYNEVNNSFKKSLIYHVGTSAGFYSEINWMLRCMLFCYANQIKFVLYADDANFTCYGKGWGEYFSSFCEETHEELNARVNTRYGVYTKVHVETSGFREKIEYYLNPDRLQNTISRYILKRKEKADYLTSDIFEPMLYEGNGKNMIVEWEELGIYGKFEEEWIKLSKVALHYSEQTEIEVQNLIDSLNLPEKYFSIQIRGGDKLLEIKKFMEVGEILQKIQQSNCNVKDIFIFTDDYKNIEEIKKRRPEWNLYYLTQQHENGYDNYFFHRLSKATKHKHMIKLLAMVEVCIKSEIHFGCEYTNVDEYIKYSKDRGRYISIISGEVKESLRKALKVR